jgi:hypothetical protein
MEITDIRRQNLRDLMDRTYGLNARGAQTRIAEALNKPQNYISRCLYPSEKDGAKNIGEDFAREIEETFNLAKYAMDRLHSFRQAIPESAATDSEIEATASPSVSRRAISAAALATPRSRGVLERIAIAAEAGRLTESDLVLLEHIAARFERTGSQVEPSNAKGSNTRLRERLRKDDSNPQQ